MKTGTLLLAVGLALPATALSAEQLAGDALRSAISGKTVYLNVSGSSCRSNIRPMAG
ncbi:hypothetical protein [Methyloceanibacter marginalis]|uniref:hypothetical protein n=1 Tax=Methyloceanibacter marginalis TaxID=1774971 RepID=UPI0013017E06|nr:hypothetical protein [Methyloceanibacter marginalis]